MSKFTMDSHADTAELLQSTKGQGCQTYDLYVFCCRYNPMDVAKASKLLQARPIPWCTTSPSHAAAIQTEPQAVLSIALLWHAGGVSLWAAPATL